MNIDIRQIYKDLTTCEKRLLANAKQVFESSYDHWTIEDTVNHAYSWKLSGLKKVEGRVKGEEVRFHAERPLDEINVEYYEKHKGHTKEETREVIERTIYRVNKVLEQIQGKESMNEYAPIGYSGSVLEYLQFDLIYHPMNHYLLYAIKNDEYGLLLELEEFIKVNRSTVFRDLGVLGLKGYMKEEEHSIIFKKGYEWEHDDLYVYMKEVSA